MKDIKYCKHLSSQYLVFVTRIASYNRKRVVNPIYKNDNISIVFNDGPVQ